MIKDQTLDEVIVEAMRFVKAAKELRHAEKLKREGVMCRLCDLVRLKRGEACPGCGALDVGDYVRVDGLTKRRSACKRASLDLTRKLADLRAGR